MTVRGTVLRTRVSATLVHATVQVRQSLVSSLFIGTHTSRSFRVAFPIPWPCVGARSARAALCSLRVHAPRVTTRKKTYIVLFAPRFLSFFTPGPRTRGCYTEHGTGRSLRTEASRSICTLASGSRVASSTSSRSHGPCHRAQCTVGAAGCRSRKRCRPHAGLSIVYRAAGDSGPPRRVRMTRDSLDGLDIARWEVSLLPL